MFKPNKIREKVGAGWPMLCCVALGILFFGVYLLARETSLFPRMTPRFALLFFLAYLFFSLCACLAYFLRGIRVRGEERMQEALGAKMHNLFKYVVGLPYAVTGESGRVRAMNSALQKLLGISDPFYHGTLNDVCGVDMEALIKAGVRGADSRTELGKITMEAILSADDTAPREALPPVANAADGLVVRMAGGRYIARAYPVTLNDRNHYVVTFTDVSELLDLKEKTERDMPAVAYIDVDNLEELAQYTHVNYRDVSRRVDDILIQWAAELNGFLREYERDRYVLFFSQEKLCECEEDKFSAILDRVRDIRLGEYGISVTLSAGISLSDSTMANRAHEAQSALDMALQRGGDQVAVRRRDGIRYYGGQTRPFQRRTKVQSRVVASYLLTKISEASNLLIMGHRNPDFDSIGSCIGVAQLGLLAGVPTKIIMDLDNPNFRLVSERLMASRTYSEMFVSGHKGLDLVRSGTLLVITDANNFQIIESPDVANSVRQVSGKIAIIDHHRQTGEYDFDPVINYIDPSASSACELISEMLEQSETGTPQSNAKLVGDEVASIMLSGIMLDTGGFTHNTGSRTLDAARYLFGKGANAEYVHHFFNEDYADYVCERSFSGCQLMMDNTVGLTWSPGTGRGADDRIAAAKEAEKLLGVRGVCAAFALIKVEGAVHISGRSDGSVNVQLILEKLGGGGRFDSAGAALSDVTLESAVADLREAIRSYFEDIEDTHRGV
ncbi:MAG: DHH family phosphoesterase [Clostridia bacterium]|nr:DHH family phosphoesterase [Clostridia bacterium]MDD7701057.1 DHH family phosphoesterase [Eubacteriales bacterium]MDY2827367.1 DHH family phosphoesterase [Eubacteriales bacterium]